MLVNVSVAEKKDKDGRPMLEVYKPSYLPGRPRSDRRIMTPDDAKMVLELVKVRPSIRPSIHTPIHGSLRKRKKIGFSRWEHCSCRRSPIHVHWVFRYACRACLGAPNEGGMIAEQRCNRARVGDVMSLNEPTRLWHDLFSSLLHNVSFRSYSSSSALCWSSSSSRGALDRVALLSRQAQGEKHVQASPQTP